LAPRSQSRLPSSAAHTLVNFASRARCCARVEGDVTTFDPAGIRPGERAIREASLEAVPNPAPARDYRIDVTFPEFTCLCPRTGYPDFATIHIAYVPDATIAELKALKLYLNRYRDQHVFHEAAINRILDDLVALLDPRWMRVIGEFTPRGNLTTVVTCQHERAGFGLPSWIAAEPGPNGRR
jgi:7-cyano-7-deazaguanine reductase